MPKRESGTSILIKHLQENVGREIPLEELNTLCAALPEG